MFTDSIAEYLNAVPKPVADITAYSESGPAAKTTIPQIVVVVPVSGGKAPKVRTQFRYTLRFLVSGTAITAKAKADELFRYFYPSGYDGRRSFTASEYLIADTFADEGEPRLVSNTGNVFYASFRLVFLVARDT